MFHLSGQSVEPRSQIIAIFDTDSKLVSGDFLILYLFQEFVYIRGYQLIAGQRADHLDVDGNNGIPLVPIRSEIQCGSSIKSIIIVGIAFVRPCTQDTFHIAGIVEERVISFLIANIICPYHQLVFAGVQFHGDRQADTGLFGTDSFINLLACHFFLSLVSNDSETIIVATGSGGTCIINFQWRKIHIQSYFGHDIHLCRVYSFGSVGSQFGFFIKTTADDSW